MPSLPVDVRRSKTSLLKLFYILITDKRHLVIKLIRGFSRLTVLQFYPLELFWTAFINLFSVLRNSQLEPDVCRLTRLTLNLPNMCN